MHEEQTERLVWQPLYSLSDWLLPILTYKES